jgi:hypothetical protein
MEYEIESKFKVYELREAEIGIDHTHDMLNNTHRYFDTKSETFKWIHDNGTEGIKYAVLEVYIKKRMD